MCTNVEFNKKNYGVITFSVDLLLLHKQPSNSSAHRFWDNEPRDQQRLHSVDERNMELKLH